MCIVVYDYWVIDGILDVYFLFGVDLDIFDLFVSLYVMGIWNVLELVVYFNGNFYMVININDWSGLGDGVFDLLIIFGD